MLNDPNKVTDSVFQRKAKHLYKYYLGYTFALLYSDFSFAQTNLILNGSFEDTVCCPFTGAQLYCTPPWFDPTTGTADYFHTCAYPLIVGVPPPGASYQYPYMGQAFVGIWTYQAGTSGREYIEYQIPGAPLIQGKKYYVGFYVNRTNEGAAPIDALHAVLSTDSITMFTATNLPYQPDISNPPGNIIDDTLNWTLVSGYYTATGGERFITIGNFYSDSLTNLGVGWPATSVSYYYIDDVFIYEYDDDTINIDTNIYVPNAFSPNGDGENDLFFVQGNLDELHCEIFNRWGAKVTELTKPNESWDGTVSGQKCNTGVYVYALSAKDKQGNKIERQGNITLLR